MLVGKVNKKVDFYQPIKKMNIKTFSHMTKVAKVTVKDRVVPMKAQRELFGRLLLIMQTRHVIFIINIYLTLVE